MLKINYANTETVNADLQNAIRYEYFEMHCLLLSGKAENLRKEIADAENAESDTDLTDAQIQALRDELASVEKMLAQEQEYVSALQEGHDAVVLSMERAGNKYSNIRNILRITASAENKKLFAYCLNFKGQEANLEALHQALDSVHVNCKLSTDGKSLATAEQYKIVNNELNKFMVYNLSLTAETAYTAKKTVRLNKEDLHRIHESYVKSVRATFKSSTNKKTKEVTTTFTGFTFTTLVKKVVKKGQPDSYDYSSLVAKIAEIAVGKISAE